MQEELEDVIHAETVARVAAGAIAKKYLAKFTKLKIYGYVS